MALQINTPGKGLGAIFSPEIGENMTFFMPIKYCLKDKQKQAQPYQCILIKRGTVSQTNDIMLSAYSNQLGEQDLLTQFFLFLFVSPQFFLFNFFLLYNIVLVLPYINMNLPRVYMCSHPEPPSHLPSHTIPQGHPSATAPSNPVSCIEPRLAISFLYDIIHISMPFSQIIPPCPSPAESKRLFYTSVSLLLSCIEGYHYHLSVLVFFFLAYFTLYNRLQFHPPHQN